MLKRIISYSLDHRLTILVAVVALVVAGIYAARKISVDVFPDLTAPTVVVMTDAHGMAPEEIEQLITFPIETAVNGASNVRRVRSTSLQGSCFVFVEFDWGMDVFKARQIVSEKLTTLNGKLPEGITPVMAPQSSVMGEILFVGLQVDTTMQVACHTSMQQLHTIGEWVVKPAILGTGGVSQVTVMGGDTKQYHVVANPHKMQYYGVALEQVEKAVVALAGNASGGIARDYGNEYSIRTMSRTCSTAEMGSAVVAVCNGRPVRLDEVADVAEASAIRMGYASANNTPAVLLSVSKQPNVNTLDVTRSIDANLDAIQASLPEDVILNSHIFRQADFIESSVGNVAEALLEGALFVLIVLMLFLGSLRTTLISIVSIPVSLLGTVLCLYLLGMEVNTMTLGGLCIAIGSLVDDAIIDVENVYKALRRNFALPKPSQLSVRDVVFAGSTEIRSSIIHATLIIIITFIPLFFLSGLEGRMLKPLGVAYIIAIFMSLLTALTLTPLLCRLMLGGDAYLVKKQKERWLTSWLTDAYKAMLVWSLNHKRPVLIASIVLLLVSVVSLLTLGRGFLPDFNEGSLTIAVVAKPGISLDESNRLGQFVEQTLLDIPEVQSTSRRTGRGDLDEHSQSTYGAEVDVNFSLSNRSKAEFVNDVRRQLSAIPGIAISVGQPLSHRIDHMVSGSQSDIAVKVFGSNLSELYMLGNKIKQVALGVDGIVDVNVEQQTETPQLQITPVREKLVAYGIDMQSFNSAVEVAINGKKVGEVFENQQSFDLLLMLDKADNSRPPTIAEIGDMLIDSPVAGKLPLREVADIVSAGGPNSISRENVQRRIIVSANVSGRDAASAVRELRQAIAEHVPMPEGYRVAFSGQFENASAAARTLLLVFLAALVMIYLLLYAEFRSHALSFIVLLNLPLALIGGVLAVRLGSGLLSISAIIGFITLFGIATRNGILLVAKYRQLELSSSNTREMVLTGSAERLMPIVMTALTTALSLIPMALAYDHAGNEIQAPMALVVLGGLVSSTLLNIVVIPIVYEIYASYSRSAASNQY